MIQEKLRNKITELIGEEVEGISTEETISELMRLINQHVKDIIGDSEYSAQIDGKKAQDMTDDMRNELREEQRKRAGI